MNDEWISVSTYAKRIGKSTTFIYNLIAEGKIEYVEFVRGKYKGFLVKFSQKNA